MPEQAIWRPQRRADVAMEVMPDGSALLYDPLTDQGHALAALAGLVWDMCDGTQTVTDITKELTQMMPPTFDTAAAVNALLAEFQTMGLLEMERD